MQGSQEDWIEMMKCEYTENGNAITCWEANVVPGYEITKLRANGTEERNLSAAITPEAGKFYNITLDKDKGYTDDGQGNYTVTSAEGLKNIAKLVNEEWKLGINITLTADIDLKGIDWTPIGKDDNKAYTGTFDGGGHTITGLAVTGSDQYAGLFGRIGSGGTVKDVTLEEVKIESDNEMSAVGGVVGYSYGNIENCSVSGSVSSNSTAGGVVGAQLSGSITGCSSSATVKGVTYAGGIAGYTNGGGSLTGCYATDSISVENNTTNAAWAGGVVGSNGSSTLTACYATGSVTSSGSGTIYAGGVTGTNDFGTLTACYHANGTISGPGGTTGGVAGRNYKGLMSYGGIITACYWGSNGQIQGIGEDQVGTGGTTMVTDGNWSGAKDAMNTALSGTSWRYVLGTDGLPALKE
ncbi:GLUG motif-containing protein [Barnesiella viscericola]|uniref:GLUG motif-containing protein n=1 Tax=Barnesiella viscericola TaxID=397865 RepID=UPI00320A0A5D